eukprot:scaffold119694_cov22-Prasinocladus_malaysianus.AAC.1
MWGMTHNKKASDALWSQVTLCRHCQRLGGDEGLTSALLNPQHAAENSQHMLSICRGSHGQ